MKKKAIKNLFKAYGKADQVKNRILFLVIALTVLLTFGIFSLAIGKIEVDTVRNIRYDGRITSAYLENGTDEEIEQLQKLTYVEQIGQEKIAGSLIDGYEEFCVCSVVDAETYENMLCPAFTDIIGSYPEKENEIMLSQRALEYIGIQEPEIGMEIELKFAWKDFKLAEDDGIQKFVLSGWFRDYTEIKSGKMQAFLSEEFLEENEIDLYPLRVWIDVKEAHLSGERIEEKLYDDVILFSENQYFISMDSAEYRAMESALGGYGMAACMALIILLSMFLLVYNILAMSMHKDIKQYGLLEVLGVTQKTISRMLLNQSIKIWALGSIVGIGLSIIFSHTIFPILVQKMYLEEMQSLENIVLFYPELLVFSILFAGIVVVWAAGLSGRKLKKLNPIEALRFEEADEYVSVKNSTGMKGSILWQLAVRNTLRSRKKFAITVSSLVLGCIVGLCAAAITEGTDYIHKLKSNSDFRIELAQEICTNEIYYLENEIVRETPFFSESQINWLKSIAEEDSIEMVAGCLPIYGQEAGKSFDVLSLEKLDRVVVVEVLSDDEVNKIGNYIADEKLSIDFENFENGNGAIIAHQHLLTDENENLQKQIGSRLELHKAVKEGTMVDQEEYVNLTNCGYLDLTEEDIPKFNLAWENREVIHLLVSGKMLQKLTEIMPEQVFSVSFDVDEKKEQELKQVLKSWITEQNIDFQAKTQSEKELFFMTANSDLIAKERNYVEGSRMIMWAISIAIIFIGLLNFLNTFTVGILSRKRELAVMESIGLTRKQLQRMLILEGIYYCVIVVGSILTIGSAVLFGVEKVMSIQVEHFYYNYPFGELIVMIIVLLSICVIVPSLMYKKMTRESVVERLRKSVM